MNKVLLFIGTALPAMSIAVSATMAAEQIEVLHHWVSESEVNAVNVIKKDLAAKGVTWADSAVGGMSGANAQQALRARIAAGDPPGAMQFLGYESVIWSQQGVIADLASEASAGGWEAALPAPVLPFVKDGDKWIAVPINMHRQNWLWGNAKLFAQAGVEQPKSWDDLVAAGEKFRAAGVVPLAISDEQWQIGILFDAILIDLHGPEFYRKTAVDLDETALSSPEMIAVFDMLRKVRGLADDNFPGRDWAVATGMVINGEAAMQFMGDWAKGEFLAKGLKPGQDFLCLETPGQQTSYQFVIDSFGMFEVEDESGKKAQLALANSTMDKQVQHDFNLIKGSIPARTDVDISDYDECAAKAAADREEAAANGAMVGALTHGFASQSEFASVFQDVASQFFVREDMTSQEAVDMLVQGIQNAR